MIQKDSLAAAYLRSERMVGRRIADSFVLVPIVGRGADLDGIFELNSVGAFIWERLDGRASGNDIVEQIVTSFAVDRKQAARDYLGFIASLSAIGALVSGAAAPDRPR